MRVSSGRYFLRRILMVALFCGIGYGLMQLPGMVMDYKMTARRAGETTTVRKDDPTIPSVAMRTPEKTRPGTSEPEPSEKPESAPAEIATIAGNAADDTIIRALQTVIDPELGVNIVDLGLILRIEQEASGPLTITMIPTSPLCPYLKQMVAAIKETVPRLTGHKMLHVDIDMQHRWTPDRLSKEGRRHFFGSNS